MRSKSLSPYPAAPATAWRLCWLAEESWRLARLIALLRGGASVRCAPGHGPKGLTQCGFSPRPTRRPGLRLRAGKTFRAEWRARPRRLDGQTVDRADKTTLDASIRQLARLLRQENDALAKMDFVTVGSVLAPKHAAAEALAIAWREAEAADDCPEALRKLGILVDQNRVLVNRAMRVQRRVLDLIARAARQGGKRR